MNGQHIINEAIDTAAPPGPRVIYLAPDCTDAAVRKRARGLIESGLDLRGFSFRRNRYNIGFQPDWNNVELGTSSERRLVGRAFLFARALAMIVRHRRLWRGAALIYARNLDLALLAWMGRRITGSRAGLVYEVLDIHRAMAGKRLSSRVIRWLERRILARCRLLVVSSPAFFRDYFQPIQRYRGPSYVLENKWSARSFAGLPRKVPWEVDRTNPTWVIGWFGNIRCRESLRILCGAADALGARVKIVIRGCSSLLGENQLHAAVGNRPNMTIASSYVAPEELASIYSNIHFNWCIDLDDGDNSRWLLPNRLYEGGYFGVPALAISGYETGRVVEQRKLGMIMKSPSVEGLVQTLASLTREQYARLRCHVEALPIDQFVDVHDTLGMARMALHGSQRQAANSAQGTLGGSSSSSSLTS